MIRAPFFTLSARSGAGLAALVVAPCFLAGLLVAFFAAGLDAFLAATFLVPVVFFLGCLVTANVAVIVSAAGEMLTTDTHVLAPA